MELTHYIAVVSKRLWLVLLSMVVAATASWIAVKDQPDVYQTAATLIIGQAIEKSDPTYRDFDISDNLGQTYAELVKLEPLLRATAAALGFEEDWKQLQGSVDVELVPGTLLMKVRAIDTDPFRAKTIADETARQLVASVSQSDSSAASQDFVQSQADSLPPRIEAAQEEILRLQAELSTAFGARQIQELQSQIDSLSAQVRDWQRTYADYRFLLGEGRLNALAVVEEARVPSTPVGTSPMFQVLFAAAIGCALGVSAAVLLEYLDNTVKTPDDVARLLGLSALGAVQSTGKSTESTAIYASRYPRSPIAEAFRALHTNLVFSSPDHPLRSLVITSAEPGDGKSTVAANLGIVMAQEGSKVVVADSDLRRPSLQKIFRLTDVGGLSRALLEEDADLDQHLQETGIENLKVLTSGPLPPNPAGLLGPRRMRNLIEIALERADVVLFDSPPLLAVTDAALLGAQTDGVLLVIRAGKTRRPAVQKAIEYLRQVDANVVGVVLNRMPTGAERAYAEYYDQLHEAEEHPREAGLWQRVLRPLAALGLGRLLRL